MDFLRSDDIFNIWSQEGHRIEFKVSPSSFGPDPFDDLGLQICLGQLPQSPLLSPPLI